MKLLILLLLGMMTLELVGCTRKTDFVLHEEKVSRHCDLYLSDDGSGNGVCFDRTDGHGKKAPFTRKDQEIVAERMSLFRLDPCPVGQVLTSTATATTPAPQWKCTDGGKQ